MELRRGVAPLFVFVVAGLSACQSGPPVAHASASPRQTAPAPHVSADPQRCERLAKRGFTPCPPTPDRLQLPPTTIRNATNGAVSDATAQQWGRAFQLTEAYYRWAVEMSARDALTSGTLADASASVELFAPDLKDIDEAKQQNAQLVDHPPQLVATQLVAVPSDLQGRMQAQHLNPKPFAFAIQLDGPASRSVRLPDGTEKLLWSVDAQQTQKLLVWGEFRDDPELGPIWYESGLYGCEGSVNVVCQF